MISYGRQLGQWTRAGGLAGSEGVRCYASEVREQSNKYIRTFFLKKISERACQLTLKKPPTDQ